MRSDFESPLSAFRSPLSALGASSAGTGRTLAACLILPLVAMAQAQEVYGTHDSTAGVVVGGEALEDYRETWADVKTPGDGRQYTVGTVEVRTTDVGAQFSGADATWLDDPADALFPGPIDFAPGQVRQVVIVQCTNAAPQAAAPASFQDIEWQRYFYGRSGDAPNFITNRACNARAISVWPTGDELTTRIAICGETYDARLPGSAETFPAATAAAPTGFIAVLDGRGELLWTHHLFGSDATQSCAVTDISIRVEGEGSSARDVVTYCGISTHGDPGLGTNLSLELASAVSGGPGPVGQWDGFVGRVSRDPINGKDVEFHAFLGTAEPTPLFGLAEVDVDLTAQPPFDRFVVVGSAGNRAIAANFDAGPTRVSSPLVLLSSEQVGNPQSDGQSIARDVLVLRDGYFDTGAGSFGHMMVVVGSTDDDQFFGATIFTTTPPFGGMTDGFVALMFEGAATQTGVFVGGAGPDGCTGVQGWNEYLDQFSVASFTETVAGNQNMLIESYYIEAPDPGFFLSDEIRLLRQQQIGGSMPPMLGGSPAGGVTERPAGMGAINATTIGLAFPTAGLLGDPAGGGIAVDQLARVNVVGYTEATDFLTGFTGLVGRGRDAAPAADAVRVVCDMLPPPRVAPTVQAFGVGRSDLSGSQGPFVLPAGMTGGTTPACALSPFGRRILDPVPVLSRMLLDYEGDAPAANVVTNGSLIISRPTSVVFTAWQWDIPGAGVVPTPPFLILAPPFANGIETFVPNNVLFGGPLLFAGVGLPGQPIRVPVDFMIGALPAPADAMTVQVLCWFPSVPMPGGLTCGPGDTTELTASVGMWLPL